MTYRQVTLPADVYDALELSAEAHGGIGRTYRFRGGTPHCIVGHANFLDNAHGYDAYGYDSDTEQQPVLSALNAAFEPQRPCAENDGALQDAGFLDERISFAKWCECLNVVRGE